MYYILHLCNKVSQGKENVSSNCCKSQKKKLPIHLWEKNPCLSIGPVQFKPTLFKGQLYSQRGTLLLRALGPRAVPSMCLATPSLDGLRLVTTIWVSG